MATDKQIKDTSDLGLTAKDWRTIITGLEMLQTSNDRKANTKGVDEEVMQLHRVKAAQVGALMAQIINRKLNLD